jgi:hypothetical protein
MLKKSSPLKLLGQMEPNLAGSIYVRSSIKLLHLFPFGDEMKKVYRGPYIDAFCQVWFHLVQLFQRCRLKYEKLTDGRRTPSDGKSSHWLWQGELKKTLSNKQRLHTVKPVKTSIYGRSSIKIAHFALIR